MQRAAIFVVFVFWTSWASASIFSVSTDAFDDGNAKAFSWNRLYTVPVSSVSISPGTSGGSLFPNYYDVDTNDFWVLQGMVHVRALLDGYADYRVRVRCYMREYDTGQAPITGSVLVGTYDQIFSGCDIIYFFDTNNDGFIGDVEILIAYEYWSDATPLPQRGYFFDVNDNMIIDDNEIDVLAEYWAEHTQLPPITCPGFDYWLGVRAAITGAQYRDHYVRFYFDVTVGDVDFTTYLSNYTSTGIVKLLNSVPTPTPTNTPTPGPAVTPTPVTAKIPLPPVQIPIAPIDPQQGLYYYTLEGPSTGQPYPDHIDGDGIADCHYITATTMTFDAYDNVIGSYTIYHYVGVGNTNSPDDGSGGLRHFTVDMPNGVSFHIVVRPYAWSGSPVYTHGDNNWSDRIYVPVAFTPTPTFTPSNTPTPTRTFTPTVTPYSAPPTATFTPTPTRTNTPTTTPTNTVGSTVTSTPTITVTNTPAAGAPTTTHTPTSTYTPTNTPGATNTPTVTFQPPDTFVPTPTNTPVNPTPTPVLTPTGVIPIYPLQSLYVDSVVSLPEYSAIRWTWDSRTLTDPYANDAQIRWVTDLNNSVPNGDPSFLSVGDFSEPSAQWIFSDFIFGSTYTVIGRNHETDGPQRHSDWIRFSFVMPTVTPIDSTPQPTPTAYSTPIPSNVTEWVHLVGEQKDIYGLLSRNE
jgi:hypothetical protein